MYNRVVFLIKILSRITFKFPIKRRVRYAIDEWSSGFNIYNMERSLFLYRTGDISPKDTIHCIFGNLTKDDYGNFRTALTYDIADIYGLKLVELGKLKIHKSRLFYILYNFWINDPDAILKANLCAFFDLYEVDVFILKSISDSSRVVANVARLHGTKSITLSHGEGCQRRLTGYINSDIFCAWHDVNLVNVDPRTRVVITGLGQYGLDVAYAKICNGKAYRNKILIVGTSPDNYTRSAILESYKLLVKVLSRYKDYYTVISLRESLDISYLEELELVGLSDTLIITRDVITYDHLPETLCGITVFMSSLVMEMQSVGIPTVSYFISEEYEYLIGDTILEDTDFVRTPNEITTFVDRVIDGSIKLEVTHDGKTLERVIKEIIGCGEI